MQAPRALAPAAAHSVTVADSHKSTLTNLPTGARKRKRHSIKEWEEHRSLVAQLYLTMSLPEIIEIVRTKSGFYASLRQWRNKMAEWKLDNKNMKHTDMQILVAKKQRRKENLGKDTVFVVNGVQMQDQRFSNFTKRAHAHTSPSAPTPEGVEYFTPRPTIDFSPEATEVRRAEKASARIAILTKEGSAGFSTQILRYDASSEPLRILFVNSSTHLNGNARTERLHHAFHQIGENAVISRGRFFREEKSTECLWKATNFAKRIAIGLERDFAGYPPLENGVISARGLPTPKFITRSWPPGAFSEETALRALRLVKDAGFILDLLGLSRDDSVRWLGPWEQMHQHLASSMEETANFVFGDTAVAYPEMRFFSLLVSFETSSNGMEPVILRMSLGNDMRKEVQDCASCDKDFFVIDAIGSQGAIKAVLSGNLLLGPRSWKDLDHFKAHHKALKSQVISTDWSLAAYLYQGHCSLQILQRCRCNGEQHFSARKHYIDVWAEQNAATWSAVPETGPDDRFELFPLERQWSVKFGDEGRRNREDPEWDPEGHESENEDVFDPSPDTVTEQLFLSPPIYFREDKL